MYRKYKQKHNKNLFIKGYHLKYMLLKLNTHGKCLSACHVVFYTFPASHFIKVIVPFNPCSVVGN